MKRILLAPLLGLAFFFPVTAQETGRGSAQSASQQLTPAQQEAAAELNEAVRSYREGTFAEAELHAEKALALDPSNKTAPLFIARTIHAQYKPGDQSEANVAIARAAIGAYQRILVQDSHNEEAYRAIAYLYGALKEDDLLRQWLFQRAIDPTFSDEKRSEAYVVLASKDWDCSFKITELPTNKTVTLHKRGMEIHYIKPKDPAEFEKAQRCANDGLEMIEAAIILAPNSEDAWTYKKELLLELAKLSEMDHDLQLKAEYTNQANAARQTSEELRSRKVDVNTTLGSPVGPADLQSSPEASPKTGFEADLEYVRKGKYTHLWVFSRKDGKRIDKNDAVYLRTNAPLVADWVATGDGLKLIAGSNFNLEQGNLDLLKKRFIVEDYAGSKP